MSSTVRPTLKACLVLLAAAAIPLHAAVFKAKFKIIGQTDIALIPFPGVKGSVTVTTEDGKVPDGYNAKQTTLGLGGRYVPMIENLPANTYGMVINSDAKGAVALSLSVSMSLPGPGGFFAYYPVQVSSSGSALQAAVSSDAFVDDGSGKASGKKASCEVTPGSSDTKAAKDLFLDFSVK